MAIIEGVDNREKAKYRVTFLRGRRNGSHIEILEIVEARDAEEALDIAFEISQKAKKWHIEKVERMNET